jgi:lipopolysaccharide heptosyltransferase I
VTVRANVLIVKLSSLGDVIHTLPAAQAIRAAWPHCRLGWVVETDQASLLHRQPFLDEVVEWDRRRWGSWPGFLRRLRRTRWDVAIDFQGLFRSGLVTFLSGASRRVGYSPGRELAHWFYTDGVPIDGLRRHAVDRYLDLAGRLGTPLPGGLEAAPGAVHEPRGAPSSDGTALFPLPSSEEDRAAVRLWLQRHGYQADRHRLVVLNPHSRRDANRWPPDQFAGLARGLLANPAIRVVLAGGTVARATCDRIAGQLGDGVWRADGAFSLPRTAALFREAGVVVTGDTGPMHMAVAVGTPVVALFGPTSPQLTGPYAADAIVLDKQIECAPCLERRCPLKYDPPKCMELITVEEVYDAVLARLGQAVATSPGHRRGA